MKKRPVGRYSRVAKSPSQMDNHIARMILHDLKLCLSGAKPDDPRMVHLKTERRRFQTTRRGAG